MPTGVERLVWPELCFVLAYVASLPCCGQRQHSGHSCFSPGTAARVARGTAFSPRGVVLSAQVSQRVWFGIACSRQSLQIPSSLALSRQSLAAFLEASLYSGGRCLEVWPESHWPGFALRQADVIQSYTAW